MKLGIPTLVRYDLLLKLLRSAEAGSLVPDEYIIVDNGGSYEPPTDLKHKIRVIRPGKNIGVAAAWNLMLDIARGVNEPIVISNDDIEFLPSTFAELSTGLSMARFVEGDGWALFGQTTACTELVGYYDENFYPAYYEDVDYDVRLTRAGITPLRPLSAPARHVGWATTRTAGEDLSGYLRVQREKNHQLFLAKWGGESRNPRWNGHPGIFQFEKPFNGNPPPGWSERQSVPDAVTMRWDVLNAIAKRLGATRYLEIGVSDGTCMRQIEVTDKWGVDPNPQDAAVRACSVFVPQTSSSFFGSVAPYVDPFDLVFIDGDHNAELVYWEIQTALRHLEAGGVICLHDVNPHTEAMQRMPWQPGEWTGDVWKTVARLRAETDDLEVVVVPSDYGIAIIHKSDKTLKKIALPCKDWDRLIYRDLEKDREYLLGCLPLYYWREWIEKNIQPLVRP